MPMIDIYTHIFRERFYAEMSKGGGSLGSFAKRFRKIPRCSTATRPCSGDAAGSRPRWTSSAVVFATDAPLAPIPETIVAVRNLGLPAGCHRADLLKQHQEAAELVADRLPARPLARTICILRRGFATAHCDDAAEASAGRPKEAQHV